MLFFFLSFLFFFTGCSPTAHIHQEITTDIYGQFPLRKHETIQCAFYSRLVYQALKKTSHFEPLENFAETYDKKQDVMTQLYEYQNHSEASFRQMSRDIRKLETVVAMSCPKILTHIPYDDIDWKHPNMQDFLDKEVPTFAQSPIEINAKNEAIDKKTKKP